MGDYSVILFNSQFLRSLGFQTRSSGTGPENAQSRVSIKRLFPNRRGQEEIVLLGIYKMRDMLSN